MNALVRSLRAVGSAPEDDSSGSLLPRFALRRIAARRRRRRAGAPEATPNSSLSDLLEPGIRQFRYILEFGSSSSSSGTPSTLTSSLRSRLCEHVYEYDGHVNSRGLPDGSGTLIYPNGTKFIGQFKDGKRTGQGVLVACHPPLSPSLDVFEEIDDEQPEDEIELSSAEPQHRQRPRPHPRPDNIRKSLDETSIFQVFGGNWIDDFPEEESSLWEIEYVSGSSYLGKIELKFDMQTPFFRPKKKKLVSVSGGSVSVPVSVSRSASNDEITVMDSVVSVSSVVAPSIPLTPITPIVVASSPPALLVKLDIQEKKRDVYHSIRSEEINPSECFVNFPLHAFVLQDEDMATFRSDPKRKSSVQVVYFGGFQDGLKQTSFGIEVFVATRTRYFGGFQNGKYHGKGTLIRPDGTYFVGDFENGNRTSGTVSLKDGVCLVLKKPNCPPDLLDGSAFELVVAEAEEQPDRMDRMKFRWILDTLAPKCPRLRLKFTSIVDKEKLELSVRRESSLLAFFELKGNVSIQAKIRMAKKLNPKPYWIVICDCFITYFVKTYDTLFRSHMEEGGSIRGGSGMSALFKLATSDVYSFLSLIHCSLTTVKREIASLICSYVHDGIFPILFRFYEDQHKAEDVFLNERIRLLDATLEKVGCEARFRPALAASAERQDPLPYRATASLFEEIQSATCSVEIEERFQKVRESLLPEMAAVEATNRAGKKSQAYGMDEFAPLLFFIFLRSGIRTHAAILHYFADWCESVHSTIAPYDGLIQFVGSVDVSILTTDGKYVTSGMIDGRILRAFNRLDWLEEKKPTWIVSVLLTLHKEIILSGSPRIADRIPDLMGMGVQQKDDEEEVQIVHTLLLSREMHPEICTDVRANLAAAQSIFTHQNIGFCMSVQEEDLPEGIRFDFSFVLPRDIYLHVAKSVTDSLF